VSTSRSDVKAWRNQVFRGCYGKSVPEPAGSFVAESIGAKRLTGPRKHFEQGGLRSHENGSEDVVVCSIASPIALWQSRPTIRCT
jgi:hypothetical protein